MSDPNAAMDSWKLPKLRAITEDGDMGDVPKTFDEAWAKYGGTWTVYWADAVVSGVKEPDGPKLRVIKGGNS